MREFRFGECRIDMMTREIWRSGELIATEPRAFDLLAYLIGNRDWAVDKDDRDLERLLNALKKAKSSK